VFELAKTVLVLDRAATESLQVVNIEIINVCVRCITSFYNRIIITIINNKGIINRDNDDDNTGGLEVIVGIRL
jgi:hypothetical protein